MDRDPLDIIAESYRVSAQTQLLLARTQTFAIILLVLTLLMLGFTVWQHLLIYQDSAAMHRVLLTNSQNIEAQTRLLRERLGQR